MATTDSNRPTADQGFAPAARLRRRAGVVLRHVAGEHMLVPTVAREVDLDSLFLLNATGVYVWERLDGHVSVPELADAVAGEFGIPVETARTDVAQFLASLRERRLAEPVEAAGD